MSIRHPERAHELRGPLPARGPGDPSFCEDLLLTVSSRRLKAMGESGLISSTSLGVITLILEALAGVVNHRHGRHKIDNVRIIEGNAGEEMLELSYHP